MEWQLKAIRARAEALAPDESPVPSSLAFSSALLPLPNEPFLAFLFACAGFHQIALFTQFSSNSPSQTSPQRDLIQYSPKMTVTGLRHRAGACLPLTIAHGSACARTDKAFAEHQTVCCDACFTSMVLVHSSGLRSHLLELLAAGIYQPEHAPREALLTTRIC